MTEKKSVSVLTSFVSWWWTGSGVSPGPELGGDTAGPWTRPHLYVPEVSHRLKHGSKTNDFISLCE